MRRFVPILAGLLCGCAHLPPPGVPTARPFDLQRYLGTWYEIARLDHRFERGLTQVSAEYRLAGDGTVEVLNRGFDPVRQRWQEARGRARFVGAPDTGLLKVSFFGPFYGTYNIIALDQQTYSYALVCGPDRSYLWLLARSPQLPAAQREALIAQARELGFATDRLLVCPQSAAVALPAAAASPSSQEPRMSTASLRCYDRWQQFFALDSGIAAVTFTGPGGVVCTRPVFRHQPATLSYDEHGLELLRAAGAPVLAVRFTPTVPGVWQWQADGGPAGGSFVCQPAPGGFVEISPRDPRYFCLSDGSPYVPIGLNLCWPPQFALPTGREFEQSGQLGTLGAHDYERWFALLAANGGNFARLWLSNAYFAPEGEAAGELNLASFARLDAVVDAARRHGIRLKLCCEHFRRVTTGAGPDAFLRRLRDPAGGAAPATMDEWFQSPRWQELWWRKIEALTARYGDDPAIFAWELWNEIDCCQTSGWPVQREWTAATLARLKRLVPRNLATNSLGSFDHPGKLQLQRDFHLPQMDFQQVHRYLDQGTALAICRTDPVAASIDAVQLSRRPDRPVLLAETGAVNDNHTGPFRYYRWDGDGLLFHDSTYPAFFAGAAGSGHVWHWDLYVDQKNLWAGFAALAEILHGVAVDREGFEPLDLSTPEYWCLLLRGRSCTLGWLRHRADRWDLVLRDGQSPSPVAARLELARLGGPPGRVTLARPWANDGVGTAAVQGQTLVFPAFRHGLVFRLDAK